MLLFPHCFISDQDEAQDGHSTSKFQDDVGVVLDSDEAPQNSYDNTVQGHQKKQVLIYDILKHNLFSVVNSQ